MHISDGILDMKRNESLMLINSFLYSFLVALSSLNYIFVLPLFLIIFFERKYLMQILKKVFLLNFFILILVIFVFFQDKNEAITLFFRTNLILLFNLTLFHKSKGYDLVRGLDSLNFPSKIISIFYFSLSLINYLQKDFKEVRNTLKLRGFKSNTTMFTYQIYGNIFGMTFIKALKKSEEMWLCMKTRGFEDKIFFLNSNKKEQTQKIITASLLAVYIKVIYELLS